MTDPPEPDRGSDSGAGPEAVIDARGLTSVGVASFVAALAGYAVLVVVARVLSPVENAEFLVFWSLLFAGFGVLAGLQQEATRGVAAATAHGADGGRGARVLAWSLVAGLAVAAAVAAVAPVWFPRLLAGQPRLVVGAVCVPLALFSGHAAAVGTLAGGRRWPASAGLIAGESLVRLVVVAAAAIAGVGLVGLEVAVGVSAATWLVALALRQMRHLPAVRSDVAARPMLRNVRQTTLAALGTAVLVVGFPSLLRLTTSPSEWATAAPLVLAISLTRAPLLIPLGAFQGVAISYFVDPRRSRGRAFLHASLAVAVAGAVLAALAALVGPPLMAALFGPEYRVAGTTMGLLTLAAAALALLTLTGSVVLALGRHQRYAAGWIVAAAVSALVLLLPLPLEGRAVLALATGPVVGAILHASTGLYDTRR